MNRIYGIERGWRQGRGQGVRADRTVVEAESRSSVPQAGADLIRWAEFNRLKWGSSYVYRRFQIGESEYFGEALLYEGKKGKWFLPPLNAYHSVYFHPGTATKPHKLSSRWHEIAGLIIREMKTRPGTAGMVFPPEITDMRPFIWSGFHVWMKYTYYLKLPFRLEEASSEIRGKIRKAAGMGYRTEKTCRMEDVMDCLLETEDRKGFSHRLEADDLELARHLLGDEVFRCYVCYSPDGEPVSASVILAMDGQPALGWVAGSKSAHLANGVVQLSQSYAFEDLSRLGCACFDFGGANIPSVSKSKAAWGAELMPYYVVQRKSLRHLLRSACEWVVSGIKRG